MSVKKLKEHYLNKTSYQKIMKMFSESSIPSILYGNDNFMEQFGPLGNAHDLISANKKSISKQIAEHLSITDKDHNEIIEMVEQLYEENYQNNLFKV